MITENVKISLDSDTAAQVALDTNFTYDVGFNLPMPKLSKLELLGINGDVDITNALSTQTFYGNRTVNISLVVKNGSVNGGLVCDNFVNTYDGQRVRLHINNLYFLRGRLTVIGDNRADALRQLSVTIDAEPLRYSTSYTPSASGLDITPVALGTNLWNATNVRSDDTSSATVTSSGGSIRANAATYEGEGNQFVVTATSVTSAGKLIRLYLENLVNCDVEVRHNGKAVNITSSTALIYTDGGSITINAFRKDTSVAASFGCTIREIATQTVVNDGKSVPLTVSHSYSTGSDSKPKLYINGTVINLGYGDVGVWDEYAPAMLKSGNNIIAAFVNLSSFNPSGASGAIKIRYRKGVL